MLDLHEGSMGVSISLVASNSTFYWQAGCHIGTSILKWLVAGVPGSIFFSLALLLVINLYEPPVNEVSFYDVMADILHEFKVLVVSGLHDSGELREVLSMQNSANIGRPAIL